MVVRASSGASGRRYRPGAPFAGVLWTPEDLTVAPAFWYDNTTAVGASTWDDKSANNYQLSTLGSTTMPTTNATGLNSMRTLTFNGTNSGLANTSVAGLRDLPRNSNYMYAFALAKRTASGGATARTVLNWSNNTNGTARFDMLYGASGNSNKAYMQVRRLDADATANLIQVAGDTSAWQMTLAQMEYATGDGYMWVDGTLNVQNLALTSSGATSNTASGAGFAMGWNGNTGTPTNFADMEIAETFGVNAQIDQDQIDRMFGYIAWKWGLVANLPPGHPYKNSPPIV